MQIKVTYSVDTDDSPSMAAGKITELESLISPYIREEEISGSSSRDRHPGVNGLRAIKGNLFTAKDVDSLVDYVSVINGRMTLKIDTLEAEFPALKFENDLERAMSEKAYAGLIDSIKSARSRVVELADDFSEGFHMAAGLTADERPVVGM